MDADYRLITRGSGDGFYRVHHSHLRSCLTALDQLLVKTKRDSERQRLAADAIAPYELLLPQRAGDAAFQEEYERLQMLFIERGLRRGPVEEQRQIAIQFVDRLQKRIAEQPQDAALRDELARRYRQLAEFLKANGQPQEAVAAYRRSLEVLEQAVADFPQSGALERTLGHYYRGFAAYCTGPEDAAECYRQAITAFERLSTIDPADVDSRYFVGSSKCYLGDQLLKAGNKSAAETCWREALVSAAALPIDYFFQSPRRGFVTGSYHQLIASLKTAKADGELEAVYRQAIEFYSRLAAAIPSEAGALVEALSYLDGLEQLLKQQARIDEALIVDRQAAEVSEKLVAGNPADVALREAAARRHLVQGQFLKGIGQFAQAAEAYRTGIAAYECLVAAFPENTTFPKTRDQAYAYLVWLLNDGGSPADAEAVCRERIALLEKSPNEADFNPAELRLLGDLLFGLGFAVRFQGRLEEAAQVFRDNRDTRQKLVSTAEATPLDRYELRRTHRALASALLLSGRIEEAIGNFQEALETAQRLTDDFPENARYQEALALCHLDLAGALQRSSQFEEANDHLQQTLALAERQPASADMCNNLAWFLATCPHRESRDPARAVTLAKKAVEMAPGQGMYWNTLGAAQYRAGDYAAASEALRKSQDLRNHGDAFDWFFLAMCHWQLGQADEARRLYNNAVAWTDANAKDNEELSHFRAEAAELFKPGSNPARSP